MRIREDEVGIAASNPRTRAREVRQDIGSVRQCSSLSKKGRGELCVALWALAASERDNLL